jgi:hypothetical protein
MVVSYDLELLDRQRPVYNERASGELSIPIFSPTEMGGGIINRFHCRYVILPHWTYYSKWIRIIERHGSSEGIAALGVL